MNRRKFLKFLGIGTATPVVIAKAVAMKPLSIGTTSPIFTGALGHWDGIPIIECNGRLFAHIKTEPQKEIYFSPLCKSDVMLQARNLLADYYLEEFDKTVIEKLNDRPR